MAIQEGKLYIFEVHDHIKDDADDEAVLWLLGKVLKIDKKYIRVQTSGIKLKNGSAKDEAANGETYKILKGDLLRFMKLPPKCQEFHEIRKF